MQHGNCNQGIKAWIWPSEKQHSPEGYGVGANMTPSPLPYTATSLKEVQGYTGHGSHQRIQRCSTQSKVGCGRSLCLDGVRRPGRNVGEVVQRFSGQSSQAHLAVMSQQALQCTCAEDAQRWEGQALTDALLRCGPGTCNCKDISEVSVVVD